MMKNKFKETGKAILYFFAAKIRFKFILFSVKGLFYLKPSSNITRLLINLFDPNSIRRKVRSKIKNTQVTLQTSEGARFNLELNDHVDWVTFINNTFDNLYKNLLDYLISKSGKNWNFIDVGANFGSVAIPIAKTSSVIAFEPQLKLFNRLITHAEINGCRSIKIENFALSSEKVVQNCGGMLTLYKPGGNSGATSFKSDWNPSLSAAEHLKVKVTTLDRYSQAFKHLPHATLFLVKIDVEGGESDVIQGATKFMAEYRPIIILEFRKDLLKEKSVELLNYLSKIPNYYISEIRYQKCSKEIILKKFSQHFSSFELALIPKDKMLYFTSS
jgi:FkbM family methyltransferase